MVITVSRQAESGGEEIVELVAQRAGLRVADRAILERMAQRGGMPIAHVARFDEVVPGVVEAVIAEWRTSVSHEQYVRRLAVVLLSLEKEGEVIIVGRGAAFVLAGPRTFHVRIVAPMPCRAARLCTRQGIPSLAAERMLRRSDEQRRRFVRQVFGGDIDSPLHYDLTLNTAELSAGAAAEMIALGAERKALERGGEEGGDELTVRLLGLRGQQGLPRLSGVVWERRWRITQPFRVMSAR